MEAALFAGADRESNTQSTAAIASPQQVSIPFKRFNTRDHQSGLMPDLSVVLASAFDVWREIEVSSPW